MSEPSSAHEAQLFHRLRRARLALTIVSPAMLGAGIVSLGTLRLLGRDSDAELAAGVLLPIGAAALIAAFAVDSSSHTHLDRALRSYSDSPACSRSD